MRKWTNLKTIHRHTKGKTLKSFPVIVNSGKFGILKRIRARINRANVGINLFLGYCKIHKNYYLDHKHTNEEIRCPICDEKWLIEHKYYPHSLNSGKRSNTHSRKGTSLQMSHKKQSIQDEYKLQKTLARAICETMKSD